MLKMIAGAEERRREYEQGLLDNYSIHEWEDLVDKKHESRVKVGKIKDIK